METWKKQQLNNENCKNMEMGSLTQLDYLILFNSMVLHLVYINFRKFPYFCDFYTSLTSNFSIFPLVIDSFFRMNFPIFLILC